MLISDRDGAKLLINARQSAQTEHKVFVNLLRKCQWVSNLFRKQ